MNKVLTLTASLGLAFLCLSSCAHADTLFLNTTQQWNQLADLPEPLQKIQQLSDTGKERQALKLIDAWIAQNPDSANADAALFMKANILFKRERYYQAFLAYDELINTYSTSALFEPVLLQEIEIARRFLKGSKRIIWGFLPVSARTEAIEILERVADSWPGSELAAQALMMQADFFYQKNNFSRAKEIYHTVIETCPRSAYFPQAMLRVAESAHHQFAGIYYDSTCLVEAQILYEKFRNAFPDKAAQIGIEQRLTQIQETLIHKDYEIADFYRRTHKLPAAAAYWETIVETYPESQWAEKSQRRLIKHQTAAK